MKLKHILTENQTGHRSEQSTEDQLLQLSQSISDGFQCCPMTRSIMTLINYSRPYHCVWRDVLMLKMLRKGVWPHLKRRVQAWLANPKIMVTFEGAKSKKTRRFKALSYHLYCFSSILTICIGAPENYTLASLLTMVRSAHRIANSTLQRRDYNRVCTQ